MDPVEVRFEAFGLGRMEIEHGEKDNIQIPYDILKDLAEMYHSDTEDLMKPFIKGLLSRLRKRDDKESSPTDK